MTAAAHPAPAASLSAAVPPVQQGRAVPDQGELSIAATALYSVSSSVFRKKICNSDSLIQVSAALAVPVIIIIILISTLSSCNPVMHAANDTSYPVFGAPSIPTATKTTSLTKSSKAV